MTEKPGGHTETETSVERKILPIGVILRVDDEGYLVSQSSPEKIVAPWDEPVAEIREAYTQHLGDRLHSLYIRGSVSRGNAIEGISDIDAFAAIHGNPDDLGWEWVKDLKESMKRKHPFVAGVDLMDGSYEEIIGGKKKIAAFLLKAMSACVNGEDLTEALPKVRPGKDALVARWGIERKVSPDYLADNKNITAAQKMRWSAKQILRAGFELVMEDEQAYTRDLYPCYELFSKHYPDKEPAMKKALEMALFPYDDEKAYQEMLCEIGPWLSKELNRKYPRKEEAELK